MEVLAILAGRDLHLSYECAAQELGAAESAAVRDLSLASSPGQACLKSSA